MDWEWILTFVISAAIAVVVARLIRRAMGGRTAASLVGVAGGVLIFFVAFFPVLGVVRNFDTNAENVASAYTDEELEERIDRSLENLEDEGWSDNDLEDLRDEIMDEVQDLDSDATRAEIRETINEVIDDFDRDTSEDTGSGSSDSTGSTGSTSSSGNGNGAQSTATSGASYMPSPTVYVAPTQSSGTGTTVNNCQFGDAHIDDMNKAHIDKANKGEWTLTVFNEGLFNVENGWQGADSFYTAKAIGDYSGGSWVSHGNPGEYIFRQTETHASFCMGINTTTSWTDENGTVINLKEQFLSNTDVDVAQVSIRVAHDAWVNIWSSTGNYEIGTDPNKHVVECRDLSGGGISCKTSDQGDITIVLPDDGIVTFWTEYETDASTFEAIVKVGPFDRSDDINYVDTR